MLETTDKIEKILKEALKKFSNEHIDIIHDEETGTIHVLYHDRHTSFPIALDCCKTSEISYAELEALAEKYEIGYVW